MVESVQSKPPYTIGQNDTIWISLATIDGTARHGVRGFQISLKTIVIPGQRVYNIIKMVGLEFPYESWFSPGDRVNSYQVNPLLSSPPRRHCRLRISSATCKHELRASHVGKMRKDCKDSQARNHVLFSCGSIVELGIA